MFKLIAVFIITVVSFEMSFAGEYGRYCTQEEFSIIRATINQEARNQTSHNMELVGRAVMTRFVRKYYGGISLKSTAIKCCEQNNKYPTRGGPIDVTANQKTKDAALVACNSRDTNVTHFNPGFTPPSSWPRVQADGRAMKFYNAPMSVTAEIPLIASPGTPEFDTAELPENQRPPTFNDEPVAM